MKYMERLAWISSLDIEELKHKEKTYKGSWKKRGGVGAFMMLARKWDRLECIVEAEGWDIFQAIKRNSSGDDGSALAEVRDLRRYLLLVEAEMMERKHVDGTPREDSNRHAMATFDADECMEENGPASGSVLPVPHRPGS